MSKRKKYGRPKNRFVTRVKKEGTKVMRIRLSKVEEVTRINKS